MAKQVNNEMLEQVQHDKKVNHHSELVSGISSFCHPELVSGSPLLCLPELVSGSKD